MKIHEYQAKEILRREGLSVPRGDVAESEERAYEIANTLYHQGCRRFAVKAQIHAGGRGKGGGIKLAESPEEVRQRAKEILGMTLVTPQTGPQGRVVRKVLVEEASTIVKELYTGFVLDRSREMIVCMSSSEGGVEIEEVARRSPEKIIKEYIDPLTGLMPYQGRKVAFKLGLPQELVNKWVNLSIGLYRTFIKYDCSILEINPLIITGDGGLLPLDAKIVFDDSALFRQSNLKEMRDLAEEDPIEVEASKNDLSYIKLDGEIGCMVNGAGLAMATMDIIKLFGGEPANFLDVGGAADAERVKVAFKIILSDPNVKAILVNIFGGIVRCDFIAEGILNALKDTPLKVPLVVRLQGTNMEKGLMMLKESGLKIFTATGMKEAGELVVSLLK